MVSASCWEELPHHQPREGPQGEAVLGWFLQSFPQAPCPHLVPTTQPEGLQMQPLGDSASRQVTQTLLSH